MPSHKPRYVILVSGRGSNMQALLQAGLPGECVAVISNRPDAAGLSWAAAQGAATLVVDHRDYAARADFDAALAEQIAALNVDWLLLAGFMRVLGADFVNRFAGRIINIHPSLLPLFPGMHTHAAAIAAGVRVHGCSVHFVTAAVDSGPIIAQAVAPVLPDDDADALAARVLRQEHRLYPFVAAALLQGRCRLEDGKAVWRDAAELFAPDAALCSPPPQ